MRVNEWQEVTKKNSKSVFQRLKFPSKEDQTQKISKSVFVTNFPDHFSARDLWNVFRLHANVVRFHRESKPTDFQPNKVPNPNMTYVASDKNMGTKNRSFASVLNVGSSIPSKATETSPAIGLDDDCLIKRDYSCSLTGKIKDINALPNLYEILSNEGFKNVKLTHLGGLWVLLDTDSIETKKKVFNHVGVGSWFSGLQSTSDSFICDERIIWISIEGLPIKAMTHNTLCVKVKSIVIINDRIKVIVKGNIFWIWVKEIDPWSHNFNEEQEDNSLFGDESVVDDLVNNSDNLMNDFALDNDKEIDHVSESSCMNENDLVYNHVSKSLELLSKSYDPFGFTPVAGNVNAEEVNSFKEPHPKENLYDINERAAFDFSFFGDILCAWDPSLFHKDNSIVSDSFVAIKGTWIPSATKMLIISIYAPQDLNEKRILWEFLGHLIDSWEGECVLLGDFNEVCLTNERYGIKFNTYGANAFNNFISMAGLVDLPLEDTLILGLINPLSI
ncbi:RNA-directed DNA polymerase, eukaryota [Tanacetum coccineum]